MTHLLIVVAVVMLAPLAAAGFGLVVAATWIAGAVCWLAEAAEVALRGGEE